VICGALPPWPGGHRLGPLASKPKFRCLVPATSFCEPADLPNPATGRKQWTRFALAEDRPLFALAGI
jgi:putative SOS response-associated peptidase YedK